MNSSGIILILFSLFIPVSCIRVQDEESAPWNHHRCAVVLSYDDGLNIHLSQVIPLLDSLNLKATFYIPGNSPTLTERRAEWSAAARNGHELGNHTMHHPCAGKSKNRNWVDPAYDLDTYSVKRMIDEIRSASLLLDSTDGLTERTFAYTCGDTAVGDTSFTNLIREDFVAARGVTGKMEKPGQINLFDIGGYMVVGQSGKELISMVEEARENGALLVLIFHGVGGEHSLDVGAEEHRELIHYLKHHEKDIWITTLRSAGKFIRSVRQ